MSVCTMKKLTLIAPKSQEEAIAKKLIWLSCVELMHLASENEQESLMPIRYENECAALEQKLRRLQEAIKALGKYRTEKDSMFSRRPSYRTEEYENSMPFCQGNIELLAQIEQSFAELSSIANERGAIQTKIASLEPWTSLDIPLNFAGTKSTRVVLGTLPAASSVDALQARLSAEYPAAVEQIGHDAAANYLCVLSHTSCNDAVDALLMQSSFVRMDFSDYNGSARAAADRLQSSLKDLDARENKQKARLTEYARAVPDLKKTYDILSIQLTALRARQTMTETQNTVILTGWIPEKELSRLDKSLSHFLCYYETADPDETDLPPVLLQNKEPFSCFESVVSLYSLPAYGTFDPTAIMAVFYFIIFGLMLGDVAYGALLTLGGMFALWKLDLNPGIRRLVKLFSICGISCMLAGILFGSYLGDLPATFMKSMFGVEITVPAVLDIVGDPIPFLIVSLAIGVIHLLSGMGVRFYILCRSHQVFDAIADIGSWYVLFAGIGVYFLNKTAGLILLGIGVLMLVCTQGRHEKNIIMKFIKGIGSLYSIINYGSDLLSYSRIMALGLASAVIASVVNMMATLMGPSVLGFVLMTVVLLIGHSVNLAINLLGTFVHTSRLQYIEFFGKFFEDGGRPFKPVQPELKYSHVQNETN